MKTGFALMTALAMVAMLVGGCAPGLTIGPTTSPSTQPPVPSGSIPSTGIIEVRVTDAPAEYNITSVNVTVSEDPEEGGVWVHRAVAEQEQEEQQGENSQIQQQN